jgi:hypothetical protein
MRGCAAMAIAALTIAQPLAQQRPIFRSGRDVVSIDVVVRDRDGNIVRGLSQSDFEIREDGRTQEVLAFTFQDIDGRPAPATATVALLAGVGTTLAAPPRPAGAPPPPDETRPLTADAVAGRRLIVCCSTSARCGPKTSSGGSIPPAPTSRTRWATRTWWRCPPSPRRWTC